MAVLLFQGHASCRVVTQSGMVIYLDPAVGAGYDLPADLVLITHEHGDHNDLSRVTQKAGCRVIRAGQALTGGVYRTFQVGDVRVEAVPAGNRNAMAGLAGRRLDWALLPIDGIYNMDAAEASRCAWTVAARHSVPIHTDPSYHYNRALAEGFDGPGRLLLEHGESTEL